MSNRFEFATTPPGVLQDDQAAEIEANFDTAPESAKPFLQDKLNNYKAFRSQFPRPLSEDEAKTKAQDFNTLAGLAEDWEGTRKTMEPARAKTLELKDATDPEAAKAGAWNRAYLEHVTGAPVADESDYATKRRAYSLTHLGGVGTDDDKEFFGAAKPLVIAQRDENRLVVGGADKASQESSLIALARKAAYNGQPLGKGVTDWQRASQGKPGYDPKKLDQYTAIAAEAHDAMTADVDAAKPVADQAWNELRKDRGEAAGTPDLQSLVPLMRGLTPDQQQLTMRMLKDRGESGDAKDKGFIEAMGTSFSRGAEGLVTGGEESRWRSKVIQSTGRFKPGTLVHKGSAIDEIAAEDAAEQADSRTDKDTATASFLSSPTHALTAEEANKWNADVSQEIKDQEILTNLRLAGQDVDPIKGGSWVRRKIFEPTANTIPLMASLMVPGAGILAMDMAARSYQNDEYTRLRGVGMDPGEADKTSRISGLAQAALDRVQAMALVGKIPSVSRALQRASLTASGLTRFGAHFAEISVEETGIELLQDYIVPAMVQDAMASRPEFDPKWGDVWRDAAAATPDTFLGMSLLSALGAAHGAHVDAHDMRELLASRASMRLAGYTINQINEIQAAPDIEKPALLAKHLPTEAPEGEARTQLIHEAIALDAEDRAKAASTSEKIKQTADEAGVTIGKGTDDAGAPVWKVKDAEGNETVHRDFGEAFGMYAKAAEDAGVKRDEPYMQALAHYAETSPGNESFERRKEGRSLEGALESALVTDDTASVDEIWRRVELERSKANNPNLQPEDFRVLGDSRTELANGIATYAARLWHGGGIVDLAEEKSEGDFKRWLASGRTTVPKMAGLIQDVETATGDKYLHGTPDNQTAVTEAYSDLVRAYATGQRGANAVTKGVRGERAGQARGIRARLRAAEARGVAPALMGALRDTWQFFKGVLKQAANLSKAQREGKLGDIEQFLSESVGIDQQVEHNKAVVGSLARESFSLAKGEKPFIKKGTQKGFNDQGEIVPKYDLYQVNKPGSYFHGSDLTLPHGATEADVIKHITDKHQSIGQSFSAVTPEQDAAYMSAVESGDEEKQQAMVDEAAKAAGYTAGPVFHHGGFDAEENPVPVVGDGGMHFGTEDAARARAYGKPVDDFISSITTEEDENGRWHWSADGADSYDFDEDGFSSESAARSNAEQYASDGAENEMSDAEELGKFTTAHLNLGKSLRTEDKVNDWAGTIAKAKEKGYNSITYTNQFEDKGSTSFIIFDPHQAKSADPITRDADGKVIPLSKRFDPGTPNISFSLDQKPEEITPEEWAALKANPPTVKPMTDLAEAHALINEASPSSAPQTESPFKSPFSFSLVPRIQEQISSVLNDPESPTTLTERETGEHVPLADILSDVTWLARNHSDKLTEQIAEIGTLYQGEFAQDLSSDLSYIVRSSRQSFSLASADYLNAVAPSLQAKGRPPEERRKMYERAQQQVAGMARAMRFNDENELPTSQKEMLRSLATLDAILIQFPPEVRGKVRGFVELAKLDTNKQRLAFLRKRIEKLDEVLETYLKKEYSEEMHDLLERARPPKGKPGERPTGKAGADVHALFDVLREAQGWDAEQVNAHIAGLQSKIDSFTLTPDQEALASREIELVRLVGNWFDRYAPNGKVDKRGRPLSSFVSPGADASRMSAAVEAAETILTDGMAAWKAHKKAISEARQTARGSLITDTGKAGTLAERLDEVDRELGTVKGWLRNKWLSLSSFEQVAHYIFGGDSAEAKALVDAERKASYLKEDLNQKMGDELNDLFKTLGGSVYKGEQLRWQMSQRTIDAGKGLKLSPLSAIQATMMWRQPDGKRHMMGQLDEDGKPIGPWHYDQAWVDNVEKQLSKDDKLVRQFLTDKYLAEWDTINPVFRDRYGVNLPHNPNYSPLTVTPQQAAAGQMVDPVTGTTVAGASVTPGSLRTRSTVAVAEPDFRDALQTYIAHSKQMAHWMAYGDSAMEASAILGNREVSNAATAKGGSQAAKVLQGWVDHFIQGGTRDAQAQLGMNELLNRMVGRASGAALVGRVSTLLIQSTQLAAAMVEMPMGSYINRFGKLLSGNLGWGASLGSEYIQRRLKQMPAVVQEAMKGLKAGKPSVLKHNIAKLGTLISGADALFTAGTYAMLHDYHLKLANKSGLHGAAAESYAHSAAEAATDRVAQPTRAGARSLFEATSVNPIARAVWAFASEARQKMAMFGWASADWKNYKQLIKVGALTFGVGGLVAQVIRNAYKDLKDDDDDELFDEKNWSVKRLALATLSQPLQGIPVVGDLTSAAIAKMTGQYQANDTLLSGIVDSGRAAKDFTFGHEDSHGETVRPWDDDEPIETTVRRVESLLTGLAATNDTISAAASAAHLVTDAFRIADAMHDDEDEKRAKERKAK